MFSADWHVGMGWVGWVGWGGDVDVLLPCTPGVRYATVFLLPVDTVVPHGFETQRP